MYFCISVNKWKRFLLVDFPKEWLSVFFTFNSFYFVW
jgi:hypothetical protein